MNIIPCSIKTLKGMEYVLLIKYNEIRSAVLESRMTNLYTIFQVDGIGRVVSVQSRTRVPSHITHPLGASFGSRHQLEGRVVDCGHRRWSLVDAGATTLGTTVGIDSAVRVAYMA
jgi:hypothetical protein